MKVEIITPEKSLFNGDAKIVQLPGIDGSFEIMNNHAPIISILSKGKIKIVEPNGNKLFFDVAGGMIEASNNNVSILAE